MSSGVRPSGCGANRLSGDEAALVDSSCGSGSRPATAAADLILELAEALEAGGEAFEDERDVGGAEVRA